MSAVRWTFTDPTTGATPDSYSFFCNPTADQPVYQKNLQFEALTAPGTLPLLFEGQDTPTTFNVTGQILVEEQYAAFVYWYSKRHAFLLTDDLGRQRYIYLTNFSPVRQLSRLYPWKHSYTLSGYMLTEVLPTATGVPANDGNNAELTNAILAELTALEEQQTTGSTET